MSDFKKIFLTDTPLIDVRSPGEFKDGHFPQSVNFPIMNDEERHLVGIEYKTSGQESAIRLGHELVSGDKKKTRIQQWKAFCEQKPNAKMYCFRGGLRSQISAQWLKEAGQEIEVIPGGYKALRTFLIANFEQQALTQKFMILAGRTGVGKTKFLNNPAFRAPFIDLEKLADHRGSAFGGLRAVGYQPAQATFENAFSIELLRHRHSPFVVLEDESRGIGAVEIPMYFFRKMKEAPLVILEKTLEERVQWIIQEYVIEKTAMNGGDSAKTHVFLADALGRITKKLGGLNYKNILEKLNHAFASEGDLYARHAPWIEDILKYYYDPMYDYSLKLNAEKIIFKGSEKECLDYLNSRL